MKPPELPSFLKRTPEQVKAETDRQERAKKEHPGRPQSKADRAALVESTIRANLSKLNEGTGPYEQTQAQLAENLAEQGRYKEAVKLDPQYQEILDAIERDDSETCNCPPLVHGRGNERELVSQDFISQEVYSEKHGRVVPLVKCTRCGMANAR